MSGFDNEYDDDDNQGNNEPDWLKKLRRDNREMAKTLKEQTEQLGKFQKDARVSTVKSVLEAKGVNPKVAGLIPADVEASEEAVSKWLDEFGDIFGVTTTKVETEPTAEQVAQSQSTPTQGVLTPEMQTLLRAVTGADAGSVNIDADTQAVAGLNALASQSTSSDDFFRQLRTVTG